MAEALKGKRRRKPRTRRSRRKKRKRRLLQKQLHPRLREKNGMNGRIGCGMDATAAMVMRGVDPRSCQNDGLFGESGKQ